MTLHAPRTFAEMTLVEEEASSEDSYDDSDYVYYSYDEDANKTRVYTSDEDIDEDKDYGSYEDSDATVTVEDEDDETMSDLVNEYHENGETSDSDASIEGVEECDDCTDVVVPAGTYHEYVEEVATEYDEYYLVRVPVTRYDVYDIVETPSTTHYVYYDTGDSEVVDQVTACEDCEDEDNEEQEEEEEEDEEEEREEEEEEDDCCDDEGNCCDDEDSSSVDERSSDDEDNSNVTYDEDYSGDEEEYCDVDDEVESVTVEEVDEYVVQEVEGGCDHCDELLFLQDDSYPQLTGDMEDNDETDSSSLVLVSPSSDTDRITWYEIEDEDEQEYQDNVEDSSNPAVSQQALFLQAVDNALDRDEDDLPDDVEDEGDDAVDGDLYWMLVSSFTNDEAGAGKVFLLPEDKPEEMTTFISGLDKPVGICFDSNNDFMYVADPTFGDKGYIYQFSIKWDEDSYFELRSTEYTIIYEGANPYSCFVDEYGNLYFVDASDNTINMVSYLDLWSGFTNYYYTLYSRDDDHKTINTPVGINVFDSEDLYFVNNVVDEEAAVLNRAQAKVKGENSASIEQKVKGENGGWALAVSDDYVYFTTTDGNLWVLDRDDKSDTSIKVEGVLSDARGICYGDANVYVADFGSNKILKFDDDNDSEDGDVWTAVENPYAVYCVNYASTVALALALLLQ
jgi:hypothetical protein